jgi:hypothetical protein
MGPLRLKLIECNTPAVPKTLTKTKSENYKPKVFNFSPAPQMKKGMSKIEKPALKIIPEVPSPASAYHSPPK